MQRNVAPRAQASADTDLRGVRLFDGGDPDQGLGGGPVLAQNGAWRGNLICFGSMLLLCVYLVLARQLRERSTLWTYLCPLYFQSGLMCVAFAAFVESVPNPMRWDWREWLMVLGLAAIPTVFGGKKNPTNAHRPTK